MKSAVIAFGWGQVSKSTSHVEELVITEEDDFKNLISLSQLEDTKVLIKEEKDGGYSRVVVDTSRPVKMKYSKKLEMFTLYLSYGHWNRVGVPQHSFYRGRES